MDHKNNSVNTEFLVVEYKTLWEYHNKLHDEQGKFIDFYLKAVGLPISLLGIALAVQKGPTMNVELIALAVGIISIPFFLIGYTIFIGFVQELANQRGYIRRISEVRDQINGQPHTEAHSIKLREAAKPIDPRIEILEGLKSGYSFGSIGFWRSQSIVIMNTTVGSAALILIMLSAFKFSSVLICVILFIALWAAQSFSGRVVYKAYLRKIQKRYIK